MEILSSSVNPVQFPSRIPSEYQRTSLSPLLARASAALLLVDCLRGRQSAGVGGTPLRGPLGRKAANRVTRCGHFLDRRNIWSTCSVITTPPGSRAGAASKLSPTRRRSLPRRRELLIRSGAGPQMARRHHQDILGLPGNEPGAKSERQLKLNRVRSNNTPAACAVGGPDSQAMQNLFLGATITTPPQHEVYT
jgi:hypothetical protein